MSESNKRKLPKAADFWGRGSESLSIFQYMSGGLNDKKSLPAVFSAYPFASPALAQCSAPTRVRPKFNVGSSTPAPTTPFADVVALDAADVLARLVTPVADAQDNS